jgi:hypothetical protein
MKEEFNKDMESLRKKNQAEILEIKKLLKINFKKTVESHSRRLEQVEDRISGLKDKIDFKVKT